MSRSPRPVLLGLNSGLHKHDAAAAVLAAEDGRLLALVEQERLSRRRHSWGESPADAATLALEIAGSSPEAVTAVAFGWDEAAYHRSIGAPWDQRAFLTQALPPALQRRLDAGATLDIDFVPHHLAHAAGALALSGFAPDPSENIAWLVADGRGEAHATSWGTFRDGLPEATDAVDLSQSLGVFYALAAEWAGLGYQGAGRLMGLAGYASAPGSPVPHRSTTTIEAPDQAPVILHPGHTGYRFPDLGPLPRDRSRHFYHPQRALLWRRFAELFPHQPAVAQGENPGGGPADPLPWAPFAAAVQEQLEDALLHLARLALAEADRSSSSGATGNSHSPKPPRLVFAGGVALNCAANGRLLDELFAHRPEDFFVPPIPHDAGVAHGAAFHLWRRRHPTRPTPPSLPHAAFGPVFTSEAIDQALKQADLTPVATGDAALRRAADLLARGGLVARFSGPADIGPRALGQRSLLADPRRRASADRLNRMKGRDPWRPVAPSVLAEGWSELFDDATPSPLTPFMLIARPVPRHAQAKIPACVHADGTARPQLVEAHALPDYHRLIAGFAQLTGVPALCNTSLNGSLEGPSEPILHTPAQAVRFLIEHPDLDALLLEDRLVIQPPGPTDA